MHHHPRKRFGQNFLQDGRIVDKIVSAIAAKAGQHIVEIGPGRGAITQGLLDSGAQVTALEIDRDLIPHLLLHFGLADNFTLMEADALRFDYSSLATPTEQLRVVGNLPYNISSPLIFLLLQHRELIKDMYFMLQKEVVERMAAESGGKSYGRLSVMVQYHCEVTPLFQVPPGAFYPAPKVDSAVVRLQPRRQLAHPATDIATLGKVVNTAFQQRRKTLRNALKGMIAEESLHSLGIDSKMRPENLTVLDFVTISNKVCEHRDRPSQLD